MLSTTGARSAAIMKIWVLVPLPLAEILSEICFSMEVEYSQRHCYQKSIPVTRVWSNINLGAHVPNQRRASGTSQQRIED
uniref:Secreted protein n=1 Tax=Ixodes ricinus TaxID=34613 RepID=A0A6B0U4J7_IXORI